MKNTVKLFGIIALAALIGFSACEQPTSPPPVTPTTITWTLGQVGGVAGEGGAAPTASTTAITITFSAAVSLTDADITIGGAASRDSTQELSSAGNAWTVPVTVEHTDNATVTINKDGVEGGTKNVLVYKEGEVQAIAWTAVADGEENTTTSTKITFTFFSAVSDLDADDITLTDGTGSATATDLTADDTDSKVWKLGIDVTSAGTISVKIDKTGISATPQDVTVHKEGEVTPVTITWEAVADGNTDTETTTSITFTFSEDVEGLELENIIITDGTGSIEEFDPDSFMVNLNPGFEDNTEWTLSGITVLTQGNIKVKIEKEGIDAGEQTVAVYKAIPAVTYTVTADGAEGSSDSTKITFTFSEAVTGLALNDITLYDRTGKAAKGNAAPTPSDNGLTWELGITVTRAKAIVVKITKAGVSAAGKNVVVYTSAAAPANPVNGVITWLYDAINFSASQLAFSDSNNDSGTYILNSYDWVSEWNVLAGEGTWSWDSVNEAVTLTATKVEIYGELVDQDGAAAAYIDQVTADAEGGISTYLDQDYDGEEENTWEEALQLWLDDENYYLGTNYTTLEEYIEGEAAKLAGNLFAPRQYTYVYSTDSTLILLEAALPVSDGSDPLTGRTFTISSEWGGEQEFEFGNDGTYSTTNDFGEAVEGSYSCTTNDNDIYRVHLQPTKIGDKTPEDYYDEADYWGDESSNYPSEADDRTLQTNQKFAMTKLVYNSTDDMISY